MSKLPLVSILIVNYNGRHLLPDCLKSLFKINYPRYEVILLDNDSQDDSVDFVKKNYPQIKLIESKENLGFTGGNNLAYQYAQGELIALLNTDTVVDKNWLTALVKTAFESKKTGIVASKIYYHWPFLEITLNSGTVNKSSLVSGNDFSPLGVILENVICKPLDLNQSVFYLSGFYQKVTEFKIMRWTNGQARLLLPYDPESKNNSYLFTIHGYPTVNYFQTQFTINLGEKILIKEQISSHQVKQFKIKINKNLAKKHYFYLVQNAGNTIFKNGLGRDRGSVIRRTATQLKEFYDFDSDYYQQPTKITAFCGASCLIKKELIEKIGFFDGFYFMYYEDLDLSLRALKRGWQIVYQPQSIVYHKHKASTQQQNHQFLLYMIEKNHLLFLLTHFPLKIFVIQFSIFLLKLIYVSIIYISFKILGYYGGWYGTYSNKFEIRKKIFIVFAKNLVHFWQNRIFWQKGARYSIAQIWPLLY